MTVSQTLRFLLKKYSSGADPHPSRTEFNAMIDAIENNAAMSAQGATGARPAAGKRGRWYWDETAARMFYDDGTAWKDQNTNGGGGAGREIVPGAAAAEGISAKAARADHTHLLKLATGDDDGALSAEDKALLDTATTAAAPDSLMLRDENGRTLVTTPTAAGHAANRGYVDGEIEKIATRPYEDYSPFWDGFSDKGGDGYSSQGEYAIVGPDLVRVDVKFKAGSGASLGSNSIRFSLPFDAAGRIHQVGDGLFLSTGPDGSARKLEVIIKPGSNMATLWAIPADGTTLRTPGGAGFPFSSASEIHATLTYQTVEL